MSKYSRKLKRVLALVLTFVMAVSVITVAPSTNVEAASNKVVKNLAGVAAAKTMNAGETSSFKATVKTTKKVSKKLLQVAVKSSDPSVVAVKVTAKPKNKKAAKKGASTISLTAGKTGTATITVTTKAKNKKNKKVTKKMVVTVNAPAPTPAPAPATTQATTAVATTQAPSNNNSGNETPTPAPTAKKVTKISSINDETGEVTLTFDGKVTEGDLKGTSLTVVGEDGNAIKAAFVEVSADGNSATYKVDPAKLQTGEYKITSDSDMINIPKEVGSASAYIKITGSSVKGLVYYKDAGLYHGIKNAKVTVDGKTVKSDEDGFYESKANAQENSQVSVKADGFFDAVKTNVNVASTKASAYNFEMEPYDISKIYIYGTVIDRAKASKVISGATVTLYEDGEEKAHVKTDKNGRYIFANEEAEPNNFESDSVVRFDYEESIVKDKKYTIKVEKELSSANLLDVYRSITTGVIDLGSSKNVEENIALTRISDIGDITLNLKWNEDAVNKDASKKVSVAFMDQDGVTELKQAVVDLTGYLKDGNDAMSNKYKLVDNKFFGDEANVKPTLPGGTYYLVIKDLDEAGKQQNATVVIPVALNEGGNFDASATITKAISRDLVYNATPSDTYGKQAYKNQKREANLKTVTDNQGTIGTDISVSTYIYQKVGDKNVLIDKSLHTALTADKGEKLAYGARINKDNLAESTSYAVETVKSNLVSGVQTLSTKIIDPCTINLQGAANIVRVKAKDLNCFRDAYTADKTAKDETVMVKSVTVSAADGSKGTVLIDKKYKLSDIVTGIDLTKCDCSEVSGLKPGKYTVTFDIDGYALSTGVNDQDDAEDVIDLENAGLVCEAKYEKVYPTTVEGVIAYKTVADNTNVVTDDGVAVLYTADKKKIVAASNWTMKGEQVVYSLRDGIDGNFGKGSYVLVIRGKGITTQAQTIEIEKDNTVVENNFVDLLFGGNAKISSMIKTANNKFSLGSNASVVAYDQYYIDPYGKEKVIDRLAARLLRGSDYNGSHTLSLASRSGETWEVANISDGKYNVEISSDTTVTETKEITVNSEYNTPITVQLRNLEDLVRINLYISNYNTDFEIGQVDYVVAVSKDGTVKNDGVFERSQQKEDSGSFYVPRNKAYVIYVYSNGAIVGEQVVTAQTKEDEDVFVNCNKIK